MPIVGTIELKYACSRKLLWMIEEAVKCGLKVDRRTVNQLGWGRQRKPHDSMNLGWRAIEYFSKKDRYKECKRERERSGIPH